MSIEANKRIARRFRTELINTGDESPAADLLTADPRCHGPDIAGDVRGWDGFMQALAGFRAGLLDRHESVEDQMAEGNQMAQRFIHHSTHQGDLMGVALTGHQGSVCGVEILRIGDGKIAETWVMFDALALLRLVGALPASQTLAV